MTVESYTVISPIVSEEVEPFCMMIVGRLWKRIQHEIDNGEDYMKDYRLRSLCNALWHAVKGLSMVVTGIRLGADSSESTCLHASMALMNEQSAIKKLLVNVNLEHMDGLIFATKELDEAVTQEIEWRKIK